MTCTLTFLHRTLVRLDISAFKKKQSPTGSQPTVFFLSAITSKSRTYKLTLNRNKLHLSQYGVLEELLIGEKENENF